MDISRTNLVLALAFGVVLAAPGGSAFAGTIVYSNPYNPVADASPSGSDCVFNSACQAFLGVTDIASQGFTLAAGTVITSADFTELDDSELAGPTSANWAFYTVSVGLPGTLLASGAAVVDGSANAGSQTINYGNGTTGSLFIDIYSFNIPSVVLSAGSYFFAFSTTSAFVPNYLAEGQTDSGAAEFLNGGPWTVGYGFGGIGGVAVELDSSTSTPEPATVGLLCVGFGIFGLMHRRKGLVTRPASAR
jgi:hypothetical protein